MKGVDVPETEVVYYRDVGGSVPFVEWFNGLGGRAQAKCHARLKRLEELGYELRRPAADYLRDGIYEIRLNTGGINYRILYFYSGSKAVVSHGIIKQQSAVPEREIGIVLRRRTDYEKSPVLHTFRMES